MTEPEVDSALSLVQSPEDTLLDLKLVVTKQGAITLSRTRYRLGEGRTIRFAMDLVAHAADCRAERDSKAREGILDKIREKLSQKNVTDKEFVSIANYKKYVCINSKNKPTLNHQAIEKERKKDGFFGIITNVKKDAMLAERIISEYKQLWQIEDPFGELKGTFKTRPVFHWTDDRIIGHIMICFLAYLCQAHLTRNLRAKAEQLNSKAIEKDCINPRLLTPVQSLKGTQSGISYSCKNEKPDNLGTN